MKKVLIISYHFPPSGGARTRRTLKFLKYLSQYGWQAVVLTSENAHADSWDPSLLKEVPQEIPVYRSRDLAAHWQRLKGTSKTHDADASAAPRPRPLRTALGAITRRLARFGKRWLAIPDPYVFLWLPFAVCKGVVVCRREKIEVIYATAPIFSTHVLAFLLGLLTRTPFVVDFRDAWVTNPMRKLFVPHLRQPVERFVEGLVVKRAKFVIATTNGIAEDFRMRYPGEPSEKFILITNGYDRDESWVKNKASEAKAEGDKKLRIVHTGNLLAERSPKNFLASLRRLFDEHPETENGVNVYFVGKNEQFLDGLYIEDYIATYNLHNVVTLTGHLPRQTAMEYQADADILLLLIGVVPKDQVMTYGVASKLFDYMLVEKPVMTLADKGPVSQIVEQTNIGPVIEPSDIKGMTEYLASAFDLFKHNRLRVNAHTCEINKYDMKVLTGNLAAQFEACLTKQ